MLNASFDWPGLVRMGMGQLGLPPDTFWSMTPWELRLALEGAGLIRSQAMASRMDRGTLEALMTAHPDGMAEEN